MSVEILWPVLYIQRSVWTMIALMSFNVHFKDGHLGLTGLVTLSVLNWDPRPIISSSELPGMSSVSERGSLFHGTLPL
jgi:hypothetical protein